MANKAIKPMWEFRAKYTRTVDGDTVVLLVDLGFNVHLNMYVRLKGVNTPELNSRSAKERVKATEAKAYVINWFLDRNQNAQTGGVEWPYVLRTQKGRSFNRWVGDVFEAGGEKGLVTHLLDTGHGEIDTRG